MVLLSGVEREQEGGHAASARFCDIILGADARGPAGQGQVL